MKKNGLLKKFKNLDLFSWIMFLIVTIWVVSMLFVVGFAFINSFKHTMDWMGNCVFALPASKAENPAFGWHFEYYLNIFRPHVKGVTDDYKSNYYNFFFIQVGANRIYIWELLWNSILYSALSTLFMMATQCMVAYAVAKYDFKFKNLLYNVAIIVMIIPIVGSLASEINIATALNLQDSVLGISIMRCKYPGLYFLVFYATFKGVSSSYMEAAEIDGAGHLQIFFNIMLPLVKTSVFAIFILLFIQQWNDYYTPMIFLPEKPVISYALYRISAKTTQYDKGPRQLVCCIASAVPIIVLFILFRNKIMGNVTMGGIKG